MTKNDELDKAFERAIGGLETSDLESCRADWLMIRRSCGSLPLTDQESVLFAVINLLSRQRLHFEGIAEQRTDPATQARTDTVRLDVVLRHAKQFAVSRPFRQRSANNVAPYIIGGLNEELEKLGLVRFNNPGTLRKYLNDHRGWGDKIEDILDPGRPRRRRQSESASGR
jgi:hypothetical protein